MTEAYLKALVEISSEINSIQELEPLLERILDTTMQKLSAERGFIFLRTSGDDSIVPKAVKNLDPQTIAAGESISMTAINSAIDEQKPILTFDTLSDDQFDQSESVVLHQIQSIACVPLMLKGELIGGIYLDSRGKKAHFTRQSLEFLSAFANQAAIAMENARLVASLREENEVLKEEVNRIYPFKEIVKGSRAMESVFHLMSRVLNNDTTVLISGETGTGKELVARAIHYNGLRKDRPFTPVNCAAIPANLMESELFGYKRGAFTGASADKKGLITIADQGTLFLDEVGEIPVNLQAKLLRFIQEREVMPIGATQAVKVDVRIVAATNRNLTTEVEAGRFREDLYYRLNVIPIHIPPLRERKKDIPLLARHFLKKYGKKIGLERKDYTREAEQKLAGYHWPGNVRELENVIERALVLSSEAVIQEHDIILKEITDKHSISPGMTIDGVSRILLEKTLKAFEGNKTRAAESMGVSLRWIHYKTKEWGIE